jgi:hypothetical protein
MNFPISQLVKQEQMTNTVQGMSDPQCVDELSCVVCETAIGWCSTGTFTDFYTDDSDTLNLCVDCHDTSETEQP